MSYRCNICNDPVPHGHSLRKHTVYRADRSILKEIPVCDECGDKLGRGVPLMTVLREAAVVPTLKVEEVKAKPPPEPVKPIEPARPLFDLTTSDDGRLIVPIKAVPMDPAVLGQRKLKAVSREAKKLPKTQHGQSKTTTMAGRKKPPASRKK